MPSHLCSAGVVLFIYAMLLSMCLQAQSESTKFLVLGDWGGLPAFPYRTPIEKAVATRLADTTHLYNTSFVLALGDNFYFDGVSSIEDPRFQETYNQVFTSNSSDIDWYLIAGNHDHNGNISAQVQYTKLVKRWNFPDLYYALSFPVSGTKQKIDVIMIDTVVLCGNSDHDFLHQQPHGPDSIKESEKQWTWIEGKLNSSKAEYLIVAGHYPVYSIAEHGSTQCLVDRLMPLLHKYHVTAYLSGHDHNLQHLSASAFNHTVEYFVIGAANFIDPSTKHKHNVPEGSCKYHWADIFSLGALAYVEITHSKMTFTFIESNGKDLYIHDIKPRF